MVVCVRALSALLRTHVYTIRYSTTRQNTHSYFLIAHTHIFSCTHIYIPSKYSGVNRCRVTSAYVLRTVVLSTHSRTSTFTLCDVLRSLRYTLRWENNVWKCCCCCCSRIKLNVNYMQMMHNKVLFANFGALCCRLSYSPPPPPPPACCSMPPYFLYISFLFLRTIFLHLHLNVTFSEAVSC